MGQVDIMSRPWQAIFYTAMKRTTTVETTATAMPAAMWSFAAHTGSDIVAC